MEYKPSFVDQLDVDYIAHHGIKGQKWGVRRFQNPDGSLTDAGRQRYYTNPQYNKKPMSERYDLKMAAKDNGIKIDRHDKISYGDITKQPNYDPSTGLLKQTSKMSSAENAAMVNPRAANASLFHSNREYYVNCTHCTAAYDLRKRGYDVAADSVSGFGENTDTIYKMYPNAEHRNVDPVLKSKNYVDWKDPNVNDKQLVNLWNESLNHAWQDNKGYEKACKQQGEKILNTCESYGPNARGNVLIHLAGGGGHSLAFENDSKGHTTFVDAQTVSMKNGKRDSMGGKGSSYYKSVICMADPYFDAEVLRYDNAKPDYNFMLNNHIITNPEIVTKTDKNGRSQTFKMYQHSSYTFE